MRVLLDTNVIISGLLWSGGPRQILEAARQQRFTVVTSEPLVDELRDVLHRPKFEKFISRANTTADALVETYLSLAQVVDPADVPETAIRDVKDVKVLACAVGGQAAIIASGDEDLLVLKQYASIQILSPQQFLDQLQHDDEPPV